VADEPAQGDAADESNLLGREPDSRSPAQKLNDRAFTLSVFSLFLPFIGLALGVVALIMALTARKQGKDAGTPVDKNSLVFAIVAICVWAVLWGFVLVPALTD
jgi:hypothetical protein